MQEEDRKERAEERKERAAERYKELAANGAIAIQSTGAPSGKEVAGLESQRHGKGIRRSENVGTLTTPRRKKKLFNPNAHSTPQVFSPSDEQTLFQSMS